MTKDDVAIFVMHANPAQIASIAAFIQGGCKAVAPVDGTRTADDHKLITYKEAAEMLCCSTMTVRRLHWEKQIEISVVRNREKVVRQSVLDYIERTKTFERSTTRRTVKAA